MANQEHLDLLKQGVKVWNSWREKYPDIRPDLSEANLSGINLSNANLYRVDLFRVNLSRTNLNEANLSNTLQLHFVGGR